MAFSINFWHMRKWHRICEHIAWDTVQIKRSCIVCTGLKQCRNRLLVSITAFVNGTRSSADADRIVKHLLLQLHYTQTSQLSSLHLDQCHPTPWQTTKTVLKWLMLQLQQPQTSLLSPLPSCPPLVFASAHCPIVQQHKLDTDLNNLQHCYQITGHFKK